MPRRAGDQPTGFIQKYIREQDAGVTAATPRKERSPDTLPKENSAREKAEQEVFQELNFMRDLGPLSRKLTVTKDDEETKAIQETILNHFLEIDPNAKNVNDEFLLSLSGLVPPE